ncbi:unnamed protein product [[Actinomadura] parvosata subsp. kistnae]|nr:unnamed protein product [Actinomadura parvosata subsp. kistnae]
MWQVRLKAGLETVKAHQSSLLPAVTVYVSRLLTAPALSRRPLGSVNSVTPSRWPAQQIDR